MSIDDSAMTSDADALGDPTPAPAPAPSDTDRPASATVGGALGTMRLLADIELNLTVELGRRKLRLREVMALRQGDIVELDKGVDEPVDVLVNGVLVGHGQIVVVGDTFGVRIDEIVPQGGEG